MRAIQRMALRHPSEMFFTSPMSIGKKDFEVIREKLAHTIKESLEIVRDASAAEVVCLNIDFFKAL